MAAKQGFASFAQTLMGQSEELFKPFLVQFAQKRIQGIFGNLAVIQIQKSSACAFAATEGKAVLAFRNGCANPQLRPLVGVNIGRLDGNPEEQGRDASEQSRFAGFIVPIDNVKIRLP